MNELSVTFKRNDLFLEAENKRKLQPYLVINKNIPQQAKP